MLPPQAPHNSTIATPDVSSWPVSSLNSEGGSIAREARPWTRQQVSRMLLELLGVVFVVEGLIMGLVWLLPSALPFWVMAIVDTSLLTLCMAVFAYLRILRPLGQEKRAVMQQADAVLNSIRDGVLLIDRQAVIRDANPAARRSISSPLRGLSGRSGLACARAHFRI